MLADAEPQVAVGRLRTCHRVISHRHAGHLDDAGLDGVNQRKIRDHPRKKCAFGIARTTQKKRRGRKIVNSLHSNFCLHGLKAGNPDASLLVALLGFNAIITSESFVLGVGFAAVAVMGFVVENDDVLLGSQLATNTSHHLVGSFG